jgi:hypothetical protein
MGVGLPSGGRRLLWVESLSAGKSAGSSSDTVFRRRPEVEDGAREYRCKRRRLRRGLRHPQAGDGGRRSGPLGMSSVHRRKTTTRLAFVQKKKN